MGLSWNMGADVGTGNLSGKNINKRLSEIVPTSGSAQHLSGAAGIQVDSAQLEADTLYCVISPASVNFASTGSATGQAGLTLGAQDPYWPADEPKYHLAKSGSSDYISVRDFAGAEASTFIFVVENRDGNG